MDNFKKIGKAFWNLYKAEGTIKSFNTSLVTLKNLTTRVRGEYKLQRKPEYKDTKGLIVYTFTAFYSITDETTDFTFKSSKLLSNEEYDTLTNNLQACKQSDLADRIDFRQSILDELAK